ncbi:glycosyltransferase [Clostridium sp.]|uniref:glycosyltransferase family 8 protein n=1 Tax=Clostridium sp. TaxID=1506 RepID=UPI00321809AD
MDKDSAYINSGVILMNLELLRKYQDFQQVFDYIEKFKNRLLLPDQDVLSGLYGSKSKTVESIVYNISDRYLARYNLDPENWIQKLDLNWIRKNTVIIHYCGKNKPWKNNYLGILDVFYKELL